MTNSQFKVLASKVISQNKTFKRGISNQTVDEVVSALMLAAAESDRIAELEKELDDLSSGTDDLYNMVFEHVELKLEFPDEVDHTDIKQLLKAHNLEVRKQAFTDAVKYMEHSDKLITTHDVEIFIAEVDVYLSDKESKS